MTKTNRYVDPHDMPPQPDSVTLPELGAVWPEGKKFDGGKNRLDLVPPEIILAIGDILTFGAGKYGERNWEKGMNWSRVYGAMMRHMLAWWGGESTDPETGRSHLWHASCCMAFLVAYEQRGDGKDDRPYK